MKYLTIVSGVLALAISTIAAPAAGPASLTVKRDVSSEMKALYADVKQHRAAIGTCRSVPVYVFNG